MSGIDPMRDEDYAPIRDLFRDGRYAEALPRLREYLHAKLPLLVPKGVAILRRNIVDALAGVLDGRDSLAARSPDGLLPPEWGELFDEVVAYLEILPHCEQLADPPTRSFFDAVLSVLCAYDPSPSGAIAELHGRTPERHRRLLLDALLAAFSQETVRFGRSAYAEVASGLGRAYLELTEDRAELRTARASVLIRMADLLFFRARGAPHEVALRTLALLDRALLEDPGNRFAERLREHVKLRSATELQIARFEHDGSSRIGGLRAALSGLRNALDMPDRLRGLVDRAQGNLGCLAAVFDVVRDVRPQMTALDPAPICRSALAGASIAAEALETSGEPRTFELHPDYLLLCLDNLLRNSKEAYARRGLRPPAPPVALRLCRDVGTIDLRDWAGGIREDLPDIFAAYVSEKAVAQSSGLGLVQARRAIELLGGTLTLTSPQPTGGAGFTIRLGSKEAGDG